MKNMQPTAAAIHFNCYFFAAYRAVPRERFPKSQ